MTVLDYRPAGETVRQFHLSKARVRALRGPIGSGKSVACVNEIVRQATLQSPNSQGVRQTRYVCVRNTNPELKTTTIKTWREWYNDDWGRFVWQPPYTHRLNFQLPDKSLVESEIIFLPLDRPGDIKKLLSMEYSGAFINEAREIPKEIIEAVDSRLRYPNGSPDFPFIVMDTNSPPEDHWWPIMSGDVPPPEYMTEEEAALMVKPDSWQFFTQPGAVIENKDSRGHMLGYTINPKRENQQRDGKSGVPDAYYTGMIPGKSRAFINVYLLNKYQTLLDGKPVYPTFRREAHVAAQPLVPSPNLPMRVGFDYGRTPAAVFCQLYPGGRWVVFAELCAINMGAKRFGQLFKRYVADRGWSHMDFMFMGDPAGDDLPQSDETSPARMLGNELGATIRAAPTNDPTVRIEAVEQILDRMTDGGPAFTIDPRCKTLISGFEGGYRFAELGVSAGSVKYDVKADKNRFSHPHDALQYVALGGGEGRRVLSGKVEQAKSVTVVRRGNVFSRRRAGERR